MKADIHPEFRKVLFYDTSSDTHFLIGSTVQTNETKEFEGETYPYMTLDVSRHHILFTLENRRSRRAMVASLSSTSVLGIAHSKTELQTKVTKTPAIAGVFLSKNLIEVIRVKTASRIALPVRQRFLQEIFHYAAIRLPPDPQPGFAIHSHSHNTGWHGWQGLGGWQGFAHIVDPDRQGRPPNSRRPNGP